MKSMRRNEFNSTEIGKRLKTARLSLKVKQKDMAEAIQVEPSYLCQIENGNANPGPEFFVRIASIYKINLNYLFLGHLDMFIDEEGKAIKEEVDLDGEIDTTEKVTWLMENSIHFRLLIQMHANQIIVTDKENIRRDIERKKTRKEKLKDK
ncbi:MAG: helix-turn-helix domain-containing protein [Acidobacteria bacterium]|jgi:transcriptional regulator with XRE-family HTH domain|nr:helix-turn-helix domain-containing protein [Acidobacteriota bacterium]